MHLYPKSANSVSLKSDIGRCLLQLEHTCNSPGTLPMVLSISPMFSSMLLPFEEDDEEEDEETPELDDLLRSPPTSVLLLSPFSLSNTLIPSSSVILIPSSSVILLE